MSPTIEIRRWWRVVVSTVTGSMFYDECRSREEALRCAEDNDSPGWPSCEVIEFTERGRERDMEYVR